MIEANKYLDAEREVLLALQKQSATQALGVSEAAMGIKDTVEYLYLALMARWENTAPTDRRQGLLDGKPERNTQITRFSYIIRKIAAGQESRVYNALNTGAQRNDSNAYISRDFSWMEQPHELSDGWYFEGCTSLVQKQSIVQALSRVGCSAALIAAIDDFVAGKSVAPHLQLNEATEERLLRIIREDEGFSGTDA